jgi:hypothetical protein
MRHGLTSAAIGLLTALCGATPALADGRRVQIDGPDNVTPGGRHLQGADDRHHLSYVVPHPEAGAGKTVAIVPMSETAVRVQFGEVPADVWNRRAPQLSLLRRHDKERRTGNG